MTPHSQYAYLDFFKFITSGIVVYRQSESITPLEFFSKKSFHPLPEAKPTYYGEMSEGARKRMARAIDLLLEIAVPRKVFNPILQKSHYFRLAFFTLTLSAPQAPHTDKDIKKHLLERFIRVWRNKGMKNYIWRAEQQKNGNIHFHFITDMFIPISELRDSWNNIQNRLEFIDYFETKFGHRDPNSTDIKSVRGANEVKAYILKYLTKDDKKPKQIVIDFDQLKKQKGKIWDCSGNLKIKNDTADFLSSEVWVHLQDLKNKGLVEQVDGEYYKLFFFNKNLRSRLFPPHFFQAYNDYLDRVRNFQDTGI